ncbi:MAG: electron transfer flavoprotein subunit beta/FixA family protein [Chloroflexota bacterium]|nr:electron transfer flavoprotein subunit beta/FixA family protein [Chloroflexota bacterium]
MKICVCIKEVPDSDVPSNKLRIDKENNKILPVENVSNIVNGFDLNAVELALRFSENYEDSSISIISIGNNLTSDVIKKPLAMGADQIITCEDPYIEKMDIHGIALVLSKIIRKTGPYDIIFCGRHASDFDNASVPFGISELLSMPLINIVKEIKVNEQKLILERVITDGFQTIESEMPLVVTTGNQVGDPRYPTLKGIMEASKKEINKISLSDLNLSEKEISPKLKIDEIYFPENENNVEIIQGSNNKEKAINLITKLKTEGII